MKSKIKVSLGPEAVVACEDAPYGLCPQCGDKGVSRERRPDGFTHCSNGHAYKSNAVPRPNE